MKAAIAALTVVLASTQATQQTGGAPRPPAPHLTLVDLKHVKGPVDEKRLRDWVELVRAHKPGAADEPVKTIVGWPAAALALTLTDVSELSQLFAWSHAHPEDVELFPAYREHTYVRRSPADKGVPVTPPPALIDEVFPLSKEELAAGNLNGLLLRGVLLQTDVALYVMHTPALLLRTMMASAAGDTSSVGVSDGEVQSVVDAGPYWTDARFLLEAVDAHPSRYGVIRWEDVVPDPTSEPLVSFWYRAICASLASEAQWANAADNLARGLELFPDDDRLQFDSGVLHEVLAGTQAQHVAESLVRMGQTPGFKGRETELGLAETSLARVVAHDPTLSEAALHYGHVLSLEGKHRDALVQLVHARDGLIDPTLRYYAWLLLGREQAAAGDSGAAHESFTQATKLFPAAQSPYVAESQLIRIDGDVQGAALGLATFFSGPRIGDATSDPWWQYDRSHSRDGAALLAAMRSAFSAVQR